MDLVSRRRAAPSRAHREFSFRGFLRSRAFTLGVLTFINLFNYVDRYVPSSTKELIKQDLKLTDAETALPLTAFMIVYMCCSPLFGQAADRGVSRRLLIAGGIVVWSLATSLGAFAWNFGSFLAARAFVGVGEAAYATIAPALLAELYPPGEVSQVLSIFYSAIPIGAAMGFLLGGWVGGSMGWRAAFLIAGLPGLALAALVVFIQDPRPGLMRRLARQKPLSTRGASVIAAAPAVVPAAAVAGPATHRTDDDDDGLSLVGPATSGDARGALTVPSWRQALAALASNRVYCLIVAGQTAVTWAAGGMGDWMAAFFQRRYGVSIGVAGTIVGAVTVCAGIGGTLAGPVVVRKLALWRPNAGNPSFLVPALSMVPAVVCTLLLLASASLTPAICALFVAQAFLWFFQGPTNSELAASVPPEMRTRAFAVSIFFSHAFGDAISPTIIGAVSDSAGLTGALLLVPLMFAAAGLFWAAGVSRRAAVADEPRDGGDACSHDEVSMMVTDDEQTHGTADEVLL